MKGIKKVVKTISFKKIPPRLLRVYLENILKKEGAKLSPGLLIKVIDKSRGDVIKISQESPVLVFHYLSIKHVSI